MTYATVPVSKRTFEEVGEILENAGYDHAFIKSPLTEGTRILMNGLALEETKVKPVVMQDMLFIDETALKHAGRVMDDIAAKVLQGEPMPTIRVKAMVQVAIANALHEARERYSP